MHIVICEDDAIQLTRVHRLTESCLGAGHVLTDFTAAAPLTEQLQRGLQPDIAILDAAPGKTGGIALAQQLNAMCPQCRIIFLAEDGSCAQEVYRADHIWLVLLEDMEKYLPLALEKAASQRSDAAENEPVLLVKRRRSTLRIPVSQVLYMERSAYHARVHTLSETLVSTQRPEMLLSGVPEGLFIWCHQSFWVNMSKVVSRTADAFVLITGATVPISRTHRAEALAAFARRQAR